jgi:hypothetical protein
LILAIFGLLFAFLLLYVVNENKVLDEPESGPSSDLTNPSQNRSPIPQDKDKKKPPKKKM